MTELPKSSAITRLSDPVDMDGSMLPDRHESTVRSVVDGRMILVRDNLSGRITGVRNELTETLLRSHSVPAVSPPAIDEHDHPVNIDADRVAATLAVAVGADQLVPLTGAPGRFAGAGMALKPVTAREALTEGVTSVRIADGRVFDRVFDPVSRALAGSGTTVTTNSRFGH